MQIIAGIKQRRSARGKRSRSSQVVGKEDQWEQAGKESLALLLNRKERASSVAASVWTCLTAPIRSMIKYH